MNNAKSFALGLVIAMVLLGFGIAIGQSPIPILGKAQVEIAQEIPILADLLVPTENGGTITTTVPLTLNVNLQISLAGATIAKVAPVTLPTLTPAVKVRDAQSVPGMAGIDELGVPYVLNATSGLVLNKWKAEENDDGGIEYEFTVSTPGKKFSSDVRVNVTYYDSDNKEIASDGVYVISSVDEQDRETRSYSDGFECEWGECAGISERAEYYIITFEVELVDFP